MGKTTIFTLRFLDGITIDKPMENAIRINNILLTTDKKLLGIFTTEFDPEVLGKAIKKRFEDAVSSPANTLFALLHSEIEEEEPTKGMINEEDAKMMGILMPYSTALWLEHDYSMEVQISYGIAINEDSNQKTCSIHPYPVLYYDARGNMQKSSFTVDELNAAVKDLEFSQTDEDKSPQPFLKCLAGFNRLNRAWLFIHAARIEHMLPYKLVNYISCLECLLSRDTTELAHKIAERTGLLIGGDQASRTDWYKSIKEAYDSRSRFIHGGIKRYDDAKLEDLSAQCDLALRELMSFFSNGSPKHPTLFSEEDSEAFNNYFLKRIFQ